MKLQHLKHKLIDFELWDTVVEASTGSLPYAQSWFLNIVSPGWEAIVSENYDYVMPLPVKKKIKLKYLVQPCFTQQLGIFSSFNLNTEITTAFLHKIPYFSYELHLNENNYVKQASPKINLSLSLKRDYESIYKNYGKNTQRNIDKASKHKLIFDDAISIHDHFEFVASCKDFQPYVSNELIFDIVKEGVVKGKIKIFGMRNTENAIIATACFLVTKCRMVNLFPVLNEEGKAKLAMFGLINSVIVKYCNSEILLDFEGSQISGVARFYTGFGAENKPYFLVKKNRPAMLLHLMTHRK